MNSYGTATLSCPERVPPLPLLKSEKKAPGLPRKAERLLRLVDEDVDPHELVLVVGALILILGYRIKRDATLAFPNLFLFPPQVRQREAEDDMALRIIGRCVKLLLESLPGLLRVAVHIRRITLQGIAYGPETASRSTKKVKAPRCWSPMTNLTVIDSPAARTP
jgi:hypothetical protein